jgi:hypothetical protein
MKNKFFFLSLLFVAVGNSLQGQNLVPNPSFEQFVSCPNAPEQMYKVTNWASYGGSSDYFNACASFPAGVPSNPWGYQNAYDGNAYAFVETYDGMNFTNTREFIGCQLLQALVPETKYFVSAYISRADNYLANAASNNFGFRFSLIPYSEFNGAPVDNFSHIHYTSIITDSVNWTRISGTFIADSAYQYFIIGNFYDNAHTDTFDINNNSAGYYIDAICVSTDSLGCIWLTNTINAQLDSKQIKIYPNPTSDMLYVKELSQSYTYSLSDCTGKIVKQGNLYPPQSIIEVGDYSNGIYFLELDKTHFNKIIINH